MTFNDRSLQSYGLEGRRPRAVPERAVGHGQRQLGRGQWFAPVVVDAGQSMTRAGRPGDSQAQCTPSSLFSHDNAGRNLGSVHGTRVETALVELRRVRRLKPAEDDSCAYADWREQIAAALESLAGVLLYEDDRQRAITEAEQARHQAADVRARLSL